MKVGIAGVSSTGKSTLAEAVARATNLPLIIDHDVHERCWLWLEQRGKLPSTKFFPSMTKEEHINFERAVLAVRSEMEDTMPDFIADETPLDYLNYFYHVCAPHQDIMPAEEFNLAEEKFWEQTQKYDIIWYLAPGQLPIVDDNRRFTNKGLLTGWDYTLRGIVGNAIDLPKPMYGFITDVPDLEKRVEVVTKSMGMLAAMEAAKKMMN